MMLVTISQLSVFRPHRNKRMLNFDMAFEGVDSTSFIYERSLGFTVDRERLSERTDRTRSW